MLSTRAMCATPDSDKQSVITDSDLRGSLSGHRLITFQAPPLCWRVQSRAASLVHAGIQFNYRRLQ